MNDYDLTITCNSYERIKRDRERAQRATCTDICETICWLIKYVDKILIKDNYLLNESKTRSLFFNPPPPLRFIITVHNLVENYTNSEKDLSDQWRREEVFNPPSIPPQLLHFLSLISYLRSRLLQHPYKTFGCPCPSSLRPTISPFDERDVCLICVHAWANYLDPMVKHFNFLCHLQNWFINSSIAAHSSLPLLRYYNRLCYRRYIHNG